MFSGCEAADKKKMAMELKLIGELHVDEDCLEELHGVLKNWKAEYL